MPTSATADQLIDSNAACRVFDIVRIPVAIEQQRWYVNVMPRHDQVTPLRD